MDKENRLDLRSVGYMIILGIIFFMGFALGHFEGRKGVGTGCAKMIDDIQPQLEQNTKKALDQMHIYGQRVGMINSINCLNQCLDGNDGANKPCFNYNCWSACIKDRTV